MRLSKSAAFFSNGSYVFSLAALGVTAKPMLGFQHAISSFSKRVLSVLQGVGMGQKLTRRRNSSPFF